MSVLVTGLFLCTAVQLDPLIENRSKPVSASLTIGDNGSVQLQGFPNIQPFGPTVAFSDGSITNIVGVGTDMAFVVWGELKGSADEFELSWFMPGEFKRGGGYTIAKIGEATCRISKKEPAR